jgi:hypothetical protein
MTAEKREKLLVSFLLVFLIALQLGRIIYVFAFEKEGFHSDENWSYGFANSYYDPYIYMDANGDQVNFNSWTSSQVLGDYLEVNKGEGFSYGSVYSNQENDMSPPLHTMILHTICSFFPETFSWWFSFSINIVSFVLAMILLYFLGASMTKSRWAALVICLFYGFTTGALNTFVYLRMYAMLAVLAILSAWLHSRMYHKNFKNIRKELLGLIAATAAGCLTHYYFLVLSFFIALCFCIYLMCIRRWKTLFAYAGVMLLSVALVFAAYPFLLAQFLGTTDYLQMPYAWRLKYCFYVFFKELTGITVFPYWEQFLLQCCAALMILAFVPPLCFLFRKEPWFKKAVRAIRRFPGYFAGKIKQTNWFILSLFLSIAASLMVIAAISNVLIMGFTTDRYLFFLMPLFTAVLISCLYFIIRAVPVIRVIPCDDRGAFRQMLLVLLCIAFLFVNNTTTGCNYLFTRGSTAVTAEELTKDASCIVVMDESWRLTYYSSRLMETDRFFAMVTSECMTHGDELQTIDPSRPLYMILETNLLPDENGALKGYEYFGDKMKFGLSFTEKEFVTYLISLERIWRVEYISSETCFAGNISIYRIYME